MILCPILVAKVDHGKNYKVTTGTEFSGPLPREKTQLKDPKMEIQKKIADQKKQVDTLCSQLKQIAKTEPKNWPLKQIPKDLALEKFLRNYMRQAELLQMLSGETPNYPNEVCRPPKCDINLIDTFIEINDALSTQMIVQQFQYCQWELEAPITDNYVNRAASAGRTEILKILDSAKKTKSIQPNIYRKPALFSAIECFFVSNSKNIPTTVKDCDETLKYELEKPGMLPERLLENGSKESILDHLVRFAAIESEPETQKKILQLLGTVLKSLKTKGIPYSDLKNDALKASNNYIDTYNNEAKKENPDYFYRKVDYLKELKKTLESF